jgi:hypothetical protein
LIRPVPKGGTHASKEELLARQPSIPSAVFSERVSKFVAQYQSLKRRAPIQTPQLPNELLIECYRNVLFRSVCTMTQNVALSEDKEFNSLPDPTKLDLAKKFLKERIKNLGKRSEDNKRRRFKRVALIRELTNLRTNKSRRPILTSISLYAYVKFKDLDAVKNTTTVTRNRVVITAATHKIVQEVVREIKEEHPPVHLRAPIREGLFLKVLERIPLPYEDRPVKIVHESPASLRVMSTYAKELLDQLETHRMISAYANSSTLWSHLEKFGDGQYCKGGNKELKHAVSLLSGRLNLPQLAPIPMHGVLVNAKARSGYLSKYLAADRGGFVRLFLSAARDVQRLAEETPEKYTCFWEIGGREKRQERDIGEYADARLILNPETPFMLVESMYAQAVTAALAARDSPITVGKTMTSQGYRRLFPLPHKALAWAGDISSFDSSLPRIVILYAFAIISSLFSQDQKTTNLFCAFARNFIYKHVVIKGGYVVRISRGTPSGSPWTAIIDSVCNWLLLTTSQMQWMTNFSLTRQLLRVSGDDCFMTVPTSVALTLNFANKITARLNDLWNVTVKQNRASKYVRQYDHPDPDECPTFLSYCFPNGEIAWGTKQHFQLAFCPNRPRNTASSQLGRLLFYETSPPYLTPSLRHNLLEMFYGFKIEVATEKKFSAERSVTENSFTYALDKAKTLFYGVGAKPQVAIYTKDHKSVFDLMNTSTRVIRTRESLTRDLRSRLQIYDSLVGREVPIVPYSFSRPTPITTDPEQDELVRTPSSRDSLNSFLVRGDRPSPNLSD